jgi:cystathionine beta-lyase/cystathionine gamma-synthase/predicted N-acetyltransferase YhbS
MEDKTIEIRPFEPDNAEAVSALIREVFDEHVSGSFEPAGVAEMHQHVAPESIVERARSHRTLVAWEEGVVVGVVEVRGTSHVSMLFVRTSHMGQGIATALMARTIETCRSAGFPNMTVNASLNAQSFYERLGFEPADEPQKIHGFAFVPMEKVLQTSEQPNRRKEREMLKKSIFTQAVHAGERAPRPDFTPVSTPVYPSVGYLYDDMKDLDGIFGGERAGYVYTRYGSPTVRSLEQAIATLEGAEDAVAFASGMGAIHAALLGAGVRSGTAVVSAADVYGATYALLEKLLAELEVRVRFVDITDLDEVARAIEEERPVAVLCEIMSNPLIKVADVPALSNMAHAAGATLIVDSTFSTPYLFRPLDFGADYAVHSATKYLGGHGDVMAGVVSCSAERGHDLRERQKLLGANLGPQEAWLVLRGLKTLPLRMRQHCANAHIVAQWLATQPAVAHVNYPGLATHPQHALAEQLFGGRGFGGMMSFDLRGAGQPEVFAFMEALELVLPATTLGDVYSLTLYPAHSSHRQLTPEVRGQLGIGEGLVRLSVGIEDAQDIIADLNQALETVVVGS